MANPGEYRFADGFKITNEMLQDFDKLGYILVRGLFTSAETYHVIKSLEHSDYKKFTFGLDDGKGGKAHQITWNHPGNDVTGMVARCRKIIETCEKLLGGEIYHYHSKLMSKPPEIGGRHIWHQDYGYWYGNGCLFPDMMTVFIAVDDCTKVNGCLQILEGSHKCGRIDHKMVAGQTGADEERVKYISSVCPHKYVEMNSGAFEKIIDHLIEFEPRGAKELEVVQICINKLEGDALFFHCNLLHCSSDNSSDKRRWALLSAYNRASNDPVKDHHHPRYTPLLKVDDSEILNCQNFMDVSGKDFLDMANTAGVKAERVFN